jgi:hypothetical protein
MPQYIAKIIIPQPAGLILSSLISGGSINEIRELTIKILALFFNSLLTLREN